MPNIWTHILFGEKVLKNLNIQSQDFPHPQIFRLGCQGPDLFFYHNFWPWSKDKRGVQIGDVIHHHHCGPFILEMIQYLKERKENQLLKSYILGFITHHILDRNTHPYINYKSGPVGNKHQKLEVIIDTILLKREYQMDAHLTPVYKQIDIGKDLNPEIIDMHLYLIHKMYHRLNLPISGSLINESYRHMIQALKILFDPLGWKNACLGKYMSSFSYQKKWDRSKDYLNQSRSRWVHPSDDQEIRYESFEDLFASSLVEGETIITQMMNYMDGYTSLEQLEPLIGNYSYSTGKDCTLSAPYLYYDPIV